MLFALICLISANLLKSQEVDSLITLKNNHFLSSLIQRPFIADAVEIDNPFAGNERYEMVGSLGLRILKMDSSTYILMEVDFFTNLSMVQTVLWSLKD